MVPPIYKFHDVEEFAIRHREATEIETGIETGKLRAFNNEQQVYEAWVLKKSPWSTYTILADLDGMKYVLPSVGKGFSIRFADEPDGETWLSCRREIEETDVIDHQPGRDLYELEVEVSPNIQKKLKQFLVPLFGSIDKPKLSKVPKKPILIHIRLVMSTATPKCEVGALDILMQKGASQQSQDAFAYLLDFKPPTWAIDFFSLFPHLRDTNQIPSEAARNAVQKNIGRFDEDQMAAFNSLSVLKCGVCFVPGGPGAGKTTWSLSVATAAQAGPIPVKVLILVDINKTADDVADRVRALYNQLGLKKTVIRLGNWARQGDFTKGFLMMFGQPTSANPDHAPTLDEAAWQRFCTGFPNPEQAHVEVLKIIGGAPHTLKWRQKHREPFRQSLIPLYRETLLEADCIVTTPVTARYHLAGSYEPDIIVFDECGHARELSVMISLAYFQPAVWFFTGDHRQTEPYVEASDHISPYASQLRVSTMERADVCNAIPYQLLINHRAYGGLERLASELFYAGVMRSDKSGDDVFPPSTMYLLTWLGELAGGKLMSSTPRLLIANASTQRSQQAGTSSFHPGHQRFVVEQIQRLLVDQKFVQAGSNLRGTIMVISPYREAVFRYRQAIKEVIARAQRRRIRVMTTDTAQGQEADVVFLDMVKEFPTRHVANPKRLCVSLTRAKQAEIILMEEGLKRRFDGPRYLELVWKRCSHGIDGTLARKAL
ncbi:P-loop containing nucleoside triphosphate hydrolase protein [Echria macrotheca]|uniref:P-loop containing nucleoside triphosphate hydrolase protein n=1 Tax=Echria macrotheca TaxID=438768 RepID=A0AAJ0B224_9PEZI|nr:P-loop containing nucleoside triphosphate hydrolase protein [Echria macrotheca]